MRLPRLIFFALCSLCLAACSSRAMLLYVSDPYWKSIGGSQRMERALSAAAETHRLRLRLVVTAAFDPVSERLPKELALTGAGVAVIGPLFSQEAAGIVSSYPSISFILMGGPTESSADENVISLRFDRRDAFHTMGFAVGISLSREPHSGAKAGVLLLSSAVGEDPEVSAFSLGLAESAAGQTPVIRALADPVDRAAIQKAVQEMRAQGVVYFLPKLGELNPSCLEALKSAGGCAVTEEWQNSGAFAQQVFLSAEDDISGGIAACLAQIGKDTKVVYGPVRIFCGRARPVPSEVAAAVSCP
jgi:hypothetical protein